MSAKPEVQEAISACQCGDDEACRFVREREALRAALESLVRDIDNYGVPRRRASLENARALLKAEEA